MIEEAYVSFEVAKLLKEKGFNEECEYFYVWYKESESHHIRSNGGTCNNELYPNEYSIPTQQVAMAWLRELHNIFIEPRAGEANGKTWYDFDIIPINGRKIVWNHYNNLPSVECNSYEEAVEVALKYTLENLI